MRYGFALYGGDDFRQLVEFAVEAEAAGWDGLFVPDAIAIETKQVPAFPFFDPWVLLGAMAIRTERIRIGTFLTALPRRRPWKLAREVVTLDHLSQGRAILAVGLGAAKDDGGFYKVGEPMDLRIRAQRLDEGLEILVGLWQAKPFTFTGQHYHVDEMTMLPPPVQKPRVPIWVPGVWPKAEIDGSCSSVGRNHPAGGQAEARNNWRDPTIRPGATPHQRPLGHHRRGKHAGR